MLSVDNRERFGLETDISSVHVLPESCIYCGMEQETILYYYLMPRETAGRNNTKAAKKHWFQEAVLESKLLAEQEEFRVLGCAVPPFYYRKKEWKAPVLSEVMETALHTAAGMTDTCVHPDLLRIFAPEDRGRWRPRESTVRMLTKHLLGQYAEKVLVGTGMVTILLGQPGEVRQQMETTWELLEPYLSRVNRMLLYYEQQETPQNEEETGPAESVDRQEELQEYLEEYYYEYGLVPQPVPYSRSRTAQAQGQAEKDPAVGEREFYAKSGAGPLRCGRERCGGVILDYCTDFRYPRIAAADCIYIDIASDGEKERLLGRKSLALAYVSPLKYLDTMVKNSYDRKVKMT